MGCNEPKPKKELIRIVRTPEGEIKLDRTGKMNGRGAYVCDDLECLKKARKNGRIGKSLECVIAEDIYDALEESITSDE